METATGNLDRAESLYQEAVTQCSRHPLENQCPSGHPFLTGLARVKKRRGQLDEARKLYEEALGKLEKIYGPRHPLAAVLHDYGGLLGRLGEFGEAERVYERVLKIREDRLGPHSPLLAESLMAYSALLREEGLQDRARELEIRAIEIRDGTPAN